MRTRRSGHRIGNGAAGPAEDRKLWSFQDGLHVATRNGQPIRVLLRTRPDGSRFAVAQRDRHPRRDRGRHGVPHLLPIAALIPCLLLVTALVIARSLRPMVRLAGDLDAGAPTT